MTAPFAQQTSWWRVHKYVEPLLAAAETWPLLGSPAWCELPDDDVRKVAAVFDGAQHHALRLEMGQEARAQASRDVAAAADWQTIGKNSETRTKFFDERPWLRRVS